ncbi:MAG: hypothetical protein ACM3QZ_11515 [Solirubrobacterales bacterium]
MKKKVISGIVMLVLFMGISAGCASRPAPTSAGKEPTPRPDRSQMTPTAEPEANSIDSYIQYIGMTREQLTKVLGETPTAVDEGGLEYKKAGFRVWFDGQDPTKVNQIWFFTPVVDFHGLKTGDSIDSFRTVFGKPIQEDSRSAYANFSYQGLILNVGYDPESRKTQGVYLIKEWH